MELKVTVTIDDEDPTMIGYGLKRGDQNIQWQDLSTQEQFQVINSLYSGAKFFAKFIKTE